MNTETDNREEGNKIIAEFCELQYRNDLSLNGWYDKGGKLVYEALSHFSGIPFDKDWNMLMPVVEKIESDFDPNMKNYVSINGCKCGIWNYWDVTEILREGESAKDFGKIKVQGKGKTKIEAVYSAVLSFINFYKTTQK